MLLSSVILVLREVLEAALLFSLLMVFSRRLGVGIRWVWAALAAGLAGAGVYGAQIDHVSEWFDGVGQEVVNASLQLAIYLLLLAIAVLAVRHVRGRAVSHAQARWLMAVAIGMAIVREGSEIMIYLAGFVQLREQLLPVLAGSLIGAGVGVSVGAVFYFLLLDLGRRSGIFTGAAILGLVAAGMVSQATLLLIQADWLPAQYPLWDSSWLIDEQTVTGQLLYALIGYEATPTPLQVGCYLAALLVLVMTVSAAALLGSRAGAHDDGVQA